MTDDAPRPLSAERSNLVAAVYGDGTPPTWFTDALDRVVDAARASAGPAPLDVELLAKALVAVLGNEEVSTVDGSMGVDRTAPLIAREYDQLVLAAARLPAAPGEPGVLPPLTPIPGLEHIRGAYDLLSPEAKAELDRALREDAKTRRRGEAAAARLPLGGSAPAAPREERPGE